MAYGNKLLSILVAEDDLILLELYAEWLADIFKDTPGVIISILSNGKEIFELLKTRRFDITILDIALPGVTGVELYRSRKESMGKVILASSYAEVFSKHLNTDDKCLILNKPFNKSKLLNTLKTLTEVTADVVKRTNCTGSEYIFI